MNGGWLSVVLQKISGSQKLSLQSLSTDRKFEASSFWLVQLAFNKNSKLHASANHYFIKIAQVNPKFICPSPVFEENTWPEYFSSTQHVCISPDCFQASVLAAAVILRLRVKLAVSAAPFLSLIETLTWCRSIALSASCNHELLMHSGCHTCIYAQIALEVCIMLLCYER